MIVKAGLYAKVAGNGTVDVDGVTLAVGVSETGLATSGYAGDQNGRESNVAR